MRVQKHSALVRSSLFILLASACACWAETTSTTQQAPASAVAGDAAAAPSDSPATPLRRSYLAELPLLKDYVAQRASSAQRANNGDAIPLAPHEKKDVANLTGPGEITHFWTTIAAPDPNHLRDIVIRIYWDGNSYPSVETPIGDFYGMGNGQYTNFKNPVQAYGTDHGMNCFWPMPFAKSARVEIENESDQRVDAYYYYIDWRKLDKIPERTCYFHAQYRQAFPNESGKPYLFVDTDGAPGHFVGVSLSIHTRVPGWWGEGDDIFTVDGEKEPSLWGTGSEDFFCGAWGFGETFYTDYFGMPQRTRMDQGADNYWNVYRLYLENPIPFKNSIKVEIEHGAAGFDETRGGSNNDYSSIAYWYQATPRPLKGTLPSAAQRTVKLVTAEDLSKGIIEPQYGNIHAKRGSSGGLQEMQPFTKDGRKWYKGDQLTIGASAKDTNVSVDINIPSDLKGPAVLRLTKAPDYGRFQLKLDGRVILNNYDAYATEVVPVLVKVGDQDLKAGNHKLEITITGKNDKSSGFHCGIDYLRVGGSPAPDEDALGTPAGQQSAPEAKKEARKGRPTS